jgi:hypothetical protein
MSLEIIVSVTVRGGGEDSMSSVDATTAVTFGTVADIRRLAIEAAARAEAGVRCPDPKDEQ